MEVKIGIRDISRELVIESVQTPEEVSDAVTAAFDAGTTLRLTDERGRVVMVPAGAIGYVEVGESTPRRVGFGGS